MRKLVLITATLLFGAGIVHAQVENDLVQINEAYLRSDYAIRVEYSIFPEASSKQASETIHSYIYRKGSARYMKQNAIETIRDSDYYFVADHEAKRFSLSKSTQQAEQDAAAAVNPEVIRNALKMAKTINMVKKGSFVTCTFDMRDSAGFMYRTFAFTYSNKDFLIRKIEITGNTAAFKGRIGISCDYETPKETDTKKLNDFLLCLDGHYLPAPAFSSYQFYNLYKAKSTH